ncbi:hypothetical protein [Rhodocista pekingensis]|uniref:Uncharacterized protein n=1 Tax=Rhodocista pekingensis TaxID=201185 RepID=A0ABW2KWC1_9PROT
MTHAAGLSGTVAIGRVLGAGSGVAAGPGPSRLAPGRGADGLLTGAVCLLAAAVLLVSCADPGARPPAPPPVALTVPEPPPAPPARVPTSPVPRPKPPVPVAQLAGVTALPGPPAAPPHLQEASFDPKTLVGLTEQETMRLLGQPSWTEEIPPAKTWRYANDRCVLRVFFFMEMTTRDFRTLSYELTSTDDQPNVAQQCFAELVAQAWHP